MPFENIFDDAPKDTKFTNKQLWELLEPTEGHLPYIYEQVYRQTTMKILACLQKKGWGDLTVEKGMEHIYMLSDFWTTPLSPRSSLL